MTAANARDLTNIPARANVGPAGRPAAAAAAREAENERGGKKRKRERKEASRAIYSNTRIDIQMERNYC